MLTMEKTADYVKRWVAAFESKDLDRVLAFYTNDVIFHSPLVARLSHDPSGTVQGKAALRAYVKKGFEVFDHIKFTVLDVLRGVDSIAIHYKGITGTHVVEVLEAADRSYREGGGAVAVDHRAAVPGAA